MEGWVDLGYLAMHRPEVELATSRSQIRRPTTTLPSHPFLACISSGYRVVVGPPAMNSQRGDFAGGPRLFVVIVFQSDVTWPTPRHAGLLVNGVSMRVTSLCLRASPAATEGKQRRRNVRPSITRNEYEFLPSRHHANGVIKTATETCRL